MNGLFNNIIEPLYQNINGTAIGTNNGSYDNNIISVSHYDLSIATSGLVMHWDLGNKSSYTGWGTTVLDLSGNGSNGTVYGSPLFNYNNKGSIELDGVNDYIQSSYIGSDSSVYTFEAWYKHLDDNSAEKNILARGRDGSGSGFSLLIGAAWNGTRHVFRTYVVTTSPATGYQAASSLVAAVGRWYHLVGVWSNPNLSLYVNGVFQSTVSTGTGLRNSSVGWTNGRNSPAFGTGGVSISRVYTRVLSASEIYLNYIAQKSRFGL